MKFQCITPECFWCKADIDGSGCTLKNIVLRKGTCRYYAPNKDCTSYDRTDLPGDSYIAWANKKDDCEIK